jgi:uracil-DNA glycosylase
MTQHPATRTKTSMADELSLLEDRIVSCERCPRLRVHCTTIGVRKRRAWRDWDYWAKPVPGWGDPEAEVLVLGLAPGAHGSNRTGRMFTGDRSGDFLYRALWETGFASQPHSDHRADGLRLRNVWITAAARCAPPGNKPSPEELRNCEDYLDTEFTLLPQVRVVVALGSIGATAYLRLLRGRGLVGSLSAYRFGHGVVHCIEGAPPLLCSYHPSQQNTSTRKLTAGMLRDIFAQAGKWATRDGFAEADRPGRSS